MLNAPTVLNDSGWTVWPCESEGSGELKSDTIFIWSFDMSFILTFLINELFYVTPSADFS